ncbi:MAG: M1 family aminopeptidase [Candidatus Aminicenantes bacterium]|nr:M1 family aminopeptidase [Candidatus Aminicenantes bacterium]
MRNLKGFYFWYNSKVLTKGWAVVLLTLLGITSFGQDSPPPQADALSFLSGMKQAFEAPDRAAYLTHFAAELRPQEDLVYDSLKLTLRMTRVVFHSASNIIEEKNGTFLFVQAVFQNDLEALFETWKLELTRDGNGWIIRAKTVMGNPTTFYNIQIPSNRVERVARFEIRHTDIEATFENVWVFYDNIPNRETGLIIIGPGRMRFSPSSETERHQLFLRYKTGVLETPLVSAYLRFSPSFFEHHIKITSAGGAAAAEEPPPGETAKARALFRRFYGDSFTVENPLVGERLSVLPQGDQAVFEFGTNVRSGFGYGCSPFSEEEIHFESRAPDQLLCLYSPAAAVDGKRQMIVSFGEKADLLRCDIDLDFQPERHFISAKARLEMAVLSPGVDNLRFNFNPDLEILKIYDPEGRELFYMQDKVHRLLYVHFLQPLEEGQTTAIDVYYRGALQPPPPTSDIQSGSWRFGPLGGSGPYEDDFLYTPSAAWYPASAEGDYFLSRFRISLPPEYLCVANGELVGEETIDEVRRVLSLEKIGNRIFVFETRKPVKSLAFIVGRFREAAADIDPSGPPIKVLVSENVRNLPGNMAEEARAIVRLYEKIFGPFPYEKLTIVQRVAATAGGHSPASFIVLNETPMDFAGRDRADFRSPVDLPEYKEFFIAHEIAHQWWGHAVTVATYHDQWLSEGLSQYAAFRYLKTKYGERELPSILKKSVSWTEKMSKYGPISLGARLSFFDYRAFQAVLYGKSCVVLFLLSDLIGEEALDRGLRSFQKTNAFRPVRTAQFIQAMEQASGRSLREFFRGWVDSHLLPQVSVTHQIVRDGEGYELKISVHQSANPMVFPLVVTWTEDGRPVRKILEVDAEPMVFSFRSGAKPAKFKVNPDRLVPGTFR